MLDAITPWLVAGFLVLAATGCVYALIAAAAMRRFTGEDASDATAFPSITILKPLHGAEPGLHDKLASFCDQDYPGPVQILFGVQDANDPAVAVVDRLIAERPGVDLQLLVSTHPAGPNPKVATLIGLQGRIRHDVVVLSDSDVSVERNYLARTVATLAQPGVGLVTCLYRGTPVPSLWARLASMAIDYDFLPNVLVGLALGLARPCFGSTIAMRRETLERIGGFDAFLEYLADDNAIGEAVRGIGMRVAIPRWIVEHACPERSFMELWSHELRWARTLRAVSPAGYAGMVVTHPLPFASLSRSDLNRELRDSRERLEQVVAEPVLGFRAPGWDVSTGTLKAVVRAGYRYDASLVPSPVFVASPVLRFVLSLGAARGLGLGRALRGAFGKRTPHLTGPGRALVEFPAAVSPVMRLPFTHTLWYLAPAKVCRRTFRTIHRSGVPLSYSFHAADLLGLEEDNVDRRMSRHPGMRWPLRPKLRLLEDVLREIVSRYQVTTYAKSLNGGAVTSWRADQA